MKKIILVILTLFFAQGIYSQNSRFNAGIVAGINFSELEGDGITDYFGLNAGIRGTARLSEHWQLATEILFSQNGEYILPDTYPLINYGQTRLNHIEIPIQFDFLIGVFQKEKFYDWRLSAGVTYTRLLTHYVEDGFRGDVSDQIIYGNKDVFLLQIGTTYHFTKNVGLNIKASLPYRLQNLDLTLAVRLVYMLG